MTNENACVDVKLCFFANFPSVLFVPFDSSRASSISGKSLAVWSIDSHCVEFDRSLFWRNFEKDLLIAHFRKRNVCHESLSVHCILKGKLIPLQARCGPEGG